MIPGGWQPFGGGMEGGDWTDLAAKFNLNDIEGFYKAVTAGYGTDVAALTGGAAVRLESLEGALIATTEEIDDFKLYDELEKSNALANVDQWVSKDRIGGFPGSAFNSEVGSIRDNSSTYKRNVAEVKYLMTKREVSVVAQTQQGIIDLMADQNMDATLELLRSAEWGFFYGNSACSSVEFDGIYKELEDRTGVGSEWFVDLRGNSVTDQAREIKDSAAFISDQGQFGKLTHQFASNLVQSDLDQKLDPGVRVMIGQDRDSVKIGTPVAGIKTSWGNIRTIPDIFIQEGQRPFVVRGSDYAAMVTDAAVSAPSAVSVSAATNASSQFIAADGGLYYWAVEGGNSTCRSALVKSSQVAVSAGQSATVQITEPVGGNETYYVVYRSKRNGANGDGDFREMVRVPKNGGGTTTYVDHNQNIPGTSIIVLLSMTRQAITMRRLLPLTKFQLYPTDKPVNPWALLFFLYMRVAKPRQHRIIKNVLPSGATWRPRG